MCCRSPRCASTTLGITCARFRRRNRGFGTGRRARTLAHTHTRTRCSTHKHNSGTHACARTHEHAHPHTRSRAHTAARCPTCDVEHRPCCSAKCSTQRARNMQRTYHFLSMQRCCAGTRSLYRQVGSALGSPLPHLRRDRAHSAHICAGTGLTPPTSAPGLGSPRPHLRRDPVEYGQVGSAHLFDLSFSQVGRCIQVRACLPRARVLSNDASVRACVRRRACATARRRAMGGAGSRASTPRRGGSGACLPPGHDALSVS
jgi:hypothetical protein